jgi:hypothetical protein
MTALYQSERENILATSYQNQGILPVCETFDKDAFQALLNVTDCEFVRIYYGMDDEYKVHAIAVAVDANDNDILPDNNPGAYLIDKGNRCPDICPPKSPLNK